MSASGVSTTETAGRTGRASGESFGQARWLAWQDMKRSWWSYPLSGLFMLFFGFITLSTLWNLQTQEVNGVSNLPQAWFFADYIFVIMGCLMAVNALSMDYLRVWTSDVFSNRTAFLLSLPISTGTLVTARAISMVAAAPLTVPAFFLPIFLFTDLGNLGFSYVWFVGIWFGWALFYAGITLLCELGLSGRVYCWISFALVFSYIVVVLLIESLFGISLVRGAESLAADYGPLPALVSIALGAAGFWFFARLTIRRVERREVGA